MSLYDSPKLNAEGYCRKCGQPLGISGVCASCEIEKLEARQWGRNWIGFKFTHHLTDWEIVERRGQGVLEYWVARSSYAGLTQVFYPGELEEIERQQLGM